MDNQTNQNLNPANPVPELKQNISLPPEPRVFLKPKVIISALVGILILVGLGVGSYYLWENYNPPFVTKPINFAVMLHLEGGGFTIADEKQFNAMNSELKQVIDLFSKYDAKITIESESPYTEAVSKWGNNQLTYALEKGMGVGTHNDVMRVNSQEELVNSYKSVKAKVDAIVGAENNIGCSGGWVAGYDWAVAAHKAGFSYLDGAVMVAALSVPEKNRPINPDTGKPFTDTEIGFNIPNNYMHDPLPPDLKDRMYPRRLKDTNDLVGDDSGVLLTTGELEELSAMSEGRKNCFPGCRLTKDDTDTLFKNIDYADSIKDNAKVSLLYFHFGLGTIGFPAKEDNLKIVEDWLSKMQEYQNEGKIKWMTMKEVYEEYNEKNPSANGTTPCGDGVCEGPEIASLCPTDCK